MKTSEMREKITAKIRGCTFKITIILAAYNYCPRVLRLAPN